MAAPAVTSCGREPEFDLGPIWALFVAMATIVLKSRVDRVNAAAARRVLAEIGLKPSDAINVLFAQIASRKALPFSLATADSSYALEEYGLDEDAIAKAGLKINRLIARERRAGTIRKVTSIADLRE